MTSISMTSMPGIARADRQRRRQRLRLVQARDLDDQLHRGHAGPPELIDDAPSQSTVRMRAGRSRPRRARRRARRSRVQRAIAAPTASGSGATMAPLTPSTTNSVGPPESVAVITGLRGQERLERDVAEILVERRIDDRRARRRRARAACSSSTAPRNVTRSATPSDSASRSMLARCVPSPATTSRSRRRPGAMRAHREIDALDALDPADRQHVVAVRARAAAAPRAAADDTAPRPRRPL